MINYDQLLELLQTRRSIRRFEDRAVSREDLHRLLEAACWAPSNHNRQPWKFIVIEDRARIQELAERVRHGMESKLKSLPEVAAVHAAGLIQYGTFFAAAPVLIVAMHKRPISAAAPLWDGLRQPELVSGEPLSVAMAMQNILLAAHALGLGACVMTAPLLAANLTDELQVPPGCGITGLIAVGYPAGSAQTPRRKTLAHIAEFDPHPSQP
ncbi:MAG: nitroreductase family protein [Verrucomicrobia bacterium]|nr:nitroreductase family protein [Verrucomicrobiota bacterium]